MPAPVLQFKGGMLAPYATGYDGNTVEWLNSESVRAGFGLSYSPSLDSHRAWCAAQHGLLMWAILDETAVHQGNLLIHMKEQNYSGYLQIYIGNPSSRGKGLGKKSLTRVLDYLFGEKGVHRVWLHVLPNNEAAINLYRHLGFVKEGVERDGLYRNGRFTSQDRWSILADEWQKLSGERE